MGYSHTLHGDADGNTDISFSQWNGFSDWDRIGTCSGDITGTQSCLVDVDSEDWGATAEWTVDCAGRRVIRAALAVVIAAANDDKGKGEDSNAPNPLSHYAFVPRTHPGPRMR